MSIPSVATVSFNRQTMEAGKAEFVRHPDPPSLALEQGADGKHVAV
jgi:hypothetical protein